MLSRENSHCVAVSVCEKIGLELNRLTEKRHSAKYDIAWKTEYGKKRNFFES